MLRAYMLDLQRKWGDDLPLVEFSCNNSNQPANKMGPFEALYMRKYITPLYLVSWIKY